MTTPARPNLRCLTEDLTTDWDNKTDKEAVEKWLHTEVVAAYDELRAAPFSRNHCLRHERTAQSNP